MQTPNTPFSRYEYVTVTFAGAGEDTFVPHSLLPAIAEDVHYQVVHADRACRIYHDQSVTRKRWPKGAVVLRADAADAAVTLLLTLPTES